MATTLTMFPVRNHHGQQLLDQYVRPICSRHNIQLKVSPVSANRGHSLAAQQTSTLVLWDCSVEPGHVYHAFNNWAKTSRKNVILSRTPLPRNVLTYQQCAPIHGAQFTNEILGEWLDKQLAAILIGTYFSENYQSQDLARYYWMFQNPAEHFLSFRGTHQQEATLWKQQFETEHETSVRMVPENEYSYLTECVTLQQRWEGVARLMHEARSTGRILIFLSEDYFDSFWTASEFLIVLWMLGRDRRTGTSLLSVENIGVVRDWRQNEIQSFRAAMLGMAVPMTQPAEMDRFAALINNCDPFTAAPETQVPPRGMAKVMAWLLRGPFGYYEPEFMDASFWNTVRVPCPNCKPKRRKPEEVSWQQHMQIADHSPALDYYGYFAVDPTSLESGRVKCPQCAIQLRLQNRRGVRTLWVPIMTTEVDKDRSVIQEHKVWEVTD